jgi:membrane protein DedA with SNARE-associated domain/rhodanese-related sulfurtransferase
MALPEHILLVYGYFLLFGWVLIEQLGVPLPATPVLLAAGALSAEHEISFVLALLAGLAASLVADSAWFLVGRRYGHHVMRLLCRMSLEPTICVRRTQDSYGRHHGITLLYAKFVPGLSTLAPPVAGQKGMDFRRFLIFDGVGATLWLGTLLIAGRLFGDLLQSNPGLLDWAGRFSGGLLAVGIIGFLVGRVVRRRMVLNKLIKARLEPEELKRWLDSGDEVFIVDLRHPDDLAAEAFTLPGALHIAPDALATRHNEIPRDRDIVLFCACRPSDATAVKTAMTLQKLGIDRVRPLRGGYYEWKRLGYPMEAVATATATTPLVQFGVSQAINLVD